MLTKEQIEEIKKRAEVVRDGPWDGKIDTIFLTHSRQDIPDLLAHNEELEAQLKILTALLFAILDLAAEGLEMGEGAVRDRGAIMDVLRAIHDRLAEEEEAGD